MRRTLATTALLVTLAAAPAADGATSPLAFASDYDWTLLACTGAVRGTVMGETGDYGTVRYEDMAFLHEAFAERAKLVTHYRTMDAFRNALAGHGSHTNATLSMGIDFDELTSVTPSTSGYLAPTNTVIDAPTLITCTTNVYFDHTTRGTRRTGEKFHVREALTQTMTNGVVDVYTNQWNDGAYLLSNVVTTVTNTYTCGKARFVFKEKDIVPFDVAVRRLYGLEYNADVATRLHGTFERATVTNLYDIARQMNRILVSFGADGAVTNTSYGRYSHEYATYDADGSRDANYDENTNWYGRVDYFYVHNSRRTWGDDGELYSESSTYYNPEKVELTYELYWPEAATTWNNNNHSRFDSVAAVAEVYVDYAKTRSRIREGDTYTQTTTNAENSVMVPATAAFTSDPRTNAMHCVKVTLSRNQLLSAVGVTDAQIPVYQSYTENDYSESLGVYLLNVHFIIKLKPKASLPNWNGGAQEGENE